MALVIIFKKALDPHLYPLYECLNKHIKKKEREILTHRSFFEPTRKISGNVVEFCSKASSSHCLNNTRRSCETFNVRAFKKKKCKVKRTYDITKTTGSKENYFTLYCRGT